MKYRFSRVGLAKLCGWFGVTRQAYYQQSWRDICVQVEEDLVLQEVLAIRKCHRFMGTRKLCAMLEPFMLANGIKMGRDALFSLLADNNLLVRKRKRRVPTTQSHHWLKKHKNLLKDLTLTHPNMAWVSDITYWKISEHKYYYISLVTDAYSKKIVGYHVENTLESIETIQALQMALGGLDKHVQGLIHHSDRGVQYCHKDYVHLLLANGIGVSMTEHGDPLENAVAERVNGILKQEYLANVVIQNIQDAKLVLTNAVALYNQQRPHLSLGNFTPEYVHEHKIPVHRNWKNYYQKPQTVNT